MGITYRESGVDIEKGNRFVALIKQRLSKDQEQNIGGFGGMFDLGSQGIRNPVLVASTDGVGTKLIIAKEAKLYSTIGIDLVAMCVNDVVCTGARPIFFLDYLATSHLDIDEAGKIMDGIVEGCGKAGCVLLGGETAEMPDLYKQGDYELAGFACGIVEKKKIIDTGGIGEGDLLIGIRSSGIHSNGFSLARKALFEKGGYSLHEEIPFLGRTIAAELLEPTRVYVPIVLETTARLAVRGVAHITGGGLHGNVRRLLPRGFDAAIRWEALTPNPVFRIIQEAGGIEDKEMRRTFNLGIGLVFVVEKKLGDRAIAILRELGENPVLVGTVVRSRMRD